MMLPSRLVPERARLSVSTRLNGEVRRDLRYALGTRSFSSRSPPETTSSDTPTRQPLAVAHLRLYRIIQRQIRQLQKHVGAHEPLLLQKPLNLHRMGGSRIFQSITPNNNGQQSASDSSSSQTDLDAIGKLFYHWERQDYQEQQDRLEDDEEDEFLETIMEIEEQAENEVDELVDGSRALSVESIRLQQLHQWMIAQPKYIARQKILEEADNFEKNTRGGSMEPFDDEIELEYYDASLWTTPHLLSQAVTRAFRAAPNTTQGILTHWAIRGFGYLQQQIDMLPLMSTNEYEATSALHNTPSKTIRMTAISQCVGQAFPAPSESNKGDGVQTSMQQRYRFVYRIRMEHLSNGKEEHEGSNSDDDAVAEELTAVQLLGRSWIIQQALMEGEGSHQQIDEPITVHAPYTGAVGKHPVLHPGQVFEYMSGCDLPIQPNGHGQMHGSFFFAHVPYEAPSASVGQVVAALADPKSYESFEVPVKPFRLQPASTSDDDSTL